MTLDEIRQLLALASAYDPRNSPTSSAERHAKSHAWHLALADLNYDQAKHAVIAHYRASSDPLMPAHIAEHIAATTPEPASQPGVIHTQLPPCDHCGLQPSHHAHTEHPYQSADAPEPITTGPPAIDWNKELRR